MALVLSKFNYAEKNDFLNNIHNYAINVNTREIYLHGECNTNCEVSIIDFRTATNFLKSLRYLSEVSSDKPIFIHLMTSGGEWDATMAIYDAIITSPMTIYMFVHGQAYSGGSVILQAADVRIMMPHARFMMHEGSVIASGTSKQVRTENALSLSTNRDMLDIYIGRCKTCNFFKKFTEKEIDAFLIEKMDKNEEWYLNAQETVNYGFADVVLGTDKNYMSINAILKSCGV